MHIIVTPCMTSALPIISCQVPDEVCMRDVDACATRQDSLLVPLQNSQHIPSRALLLPPPKQYTKLIRLETYTLLGHLSGSQQLLNRDHAAPSHSMGKNMDRHLLQLY